MPATRTIAALAAAGLTALAAPAVGGAPGRADRVQERQLPAHARRAQQRLRALQRQPHVRLDPARPGHLRREPARRAPARSASSTLPHFENEDVDIERRASSCSSPTTRARAWAACTSSTCAIRPSPRSISTLRHGRHRPRASARPSPSSPLGTGHTASCVARLQVRLPRGHPHRDRHRRPHAIPTARRATSSASPADEASRRPDRPTTSSSTDAGRAWIVGAGGTAAYDVSDPLTRCSSHRTDDSGQSDYAQTSAHDGSTLNDFIHHNSMRLRNSSLASPPPGADLGRRLERRRGHRGGLQPPDVRGRRLVADVGDLERPAPTSRSCTARLAGRSRSTRRAQALCSAHYFDERGGLIAQGWYEQGTRFLDVTNPRDIRQVGYWIPQQRDVGRAITRRPTRRARSSTRSTTLRGDRRPPLRPGGST